MAASIAIPNEELMNTFEVLNQTEGQKSVKSSGEDWSEFKDLKLAEFCAAKPIDMANFLHYCPKLTTLQLKSSQERLISKIDYSVSIYSFLHNAIFA